MIAIRTFRNSDVPMLAALWNEHRAEAGNSNRLPIAALETIVLTRPFFQPENLLVATIDDLPVGYIHWVGMPDGSAEAVIASIAVPFHSAQDQIAAQLIDQAIAAARRGGASRLLAGQAPEHLTGYIGLDCHGLGAGVLQREVAAIRWFTQMGFEPERELETHSIYAAAYRPAFDRELIALRRTTTIDRRRDVTDLPFRVAAAMSHLEVQRFVANSRAGVRLAQVNVMVADPDMPVVSGGLALVSRWEGFSVAPNSASAAIRFVLTAAVTELIAERMARIKTIIPAENTRDASILGAVGFQLDERGTVYARDVR